MAVGDCCSERILCLAHVLSLILWEDFHYHERTFLAVEIHVNLEVLTRLNRLTVEVPGDRRHGVTTEENLENDTVTVVHCLVSQRQGEPWWLLFPRTKRYDGTWF